MKNEQILEFHTIENEPHNASVYVNYTLEGVENHTFIPYFALTEISPQALAEIGLKFNEEDLSSLPQEELEEISHKYIRNRVRFDLILENRKLKDQVTRLNTMLCCIKAVAVELNKTYVKRQKYITEANVLTRHLNPTYYKYLGEAVLCKFLAGHLTGIVYWVETGKMPR